MYYLHEKHRTPIIVQYYIASCVSWEPRLSLLDSMNKPDLRTLSRNGTLSYVGDLLYLQRYGQVQRNPRMALSCCHLLAQRDQGKEQPSELRSQNLYKGPPWASLLTSLPVPGAPGREPENKFPRGEVSRKHTGPVWSRPVGSASRATEQERRGECALRGKACRWSVPGRFCPEPCCLGNHLPCHVLFLFPWVLSCHSPPCRWGAELWAAWGLTLSLASSGGEWLPFGDIRWHPICPPRPRTQHRFPCASELTLTAWDKEVVSSEKQTTPI